MKIVVTDGYTLNPGDLSWEGVKAFGDVNVYERTPVELIVERCKNTDLVITNKVPFNREAIFSLPQLKMISVSATGYNVIDVRAASEKGIVVCNVPGYGTASVAQHAFALLLESTNHVGQNAVTTANGKWQQADDWCYTEAPVTELDGKVLGIVGFGNIGRRVARIAVSFGMIVIYYNPSEKSPEMGKAVDLETVFSASDFISLHCPLTKDNNEFVNKDLIATMKRSAVLINTARGQLINEQDLADALNTEVIKAACLDVLSKEPPLDLNPLLTAKNCMITPHNAWISIEARKRIMDTTVKNIEAFINGKPANIVKA